VVRNPLVVDLGSDSGEEDQPKRAANHTGCKHGAAHSEAEHQRKRSHHSRNPMQSVVSSNQLAEIVDTTVDEPTPAHSRKSPYRSGRARCSAGWLMSMASRRM